MWPLCTANNFFWLLIPLLIGILTGLWAWGGRKSGNALAVPGADRALTGSAVGWRETSRDTKETSNRFSTLGGDRPSMTPLPLRSGHPDEQGAGSTREMDGRLAGGGAAGAGMTAIGIPAATGEPDDLERVKGIGPRLADLLNSLGIRRFDQIAAWGPGEVAKVDSRLGGFRGRIERDDWIEQARLLARGAIDEFEARFGNRNTNDA